MSCPEIQAKCLLYKVLEVVKPLSIVYKKFFSCKASKTFLACYSLSSTYLHGDQAYKHFARESKFQRFVKQCWYIRLPELREVQIILFVLKCIHKLQEQ